MITTYFLRIISNENKELINNIIGVKSDSRSKSWTYRVIKEELDNYFDFINNFLDLLEGKYQALADIGIQKNNITIWMIEEFSGDCNMEFDPVRMKRLGDNGINLCITCYEVDSNSSTKPDDTII